MTGRVQSVAVVGRDAALWLTAAAVQRSLGSLGVAVRAVELPSHLQDPDIYSAIPSIQGLHRQIGISEELVLKVAKAVPLVAQRYANWAGATAPYMLAYDNPPPPGSDISFAQYWLKGRNEGLRIELEDFSLGVSAAKRGRVPVQREGAPLSANYGYNLHARSYCALLKHHAERMGVRAQNVTLDGVEVDGERISAIALTGGECVEADLFIDASGVEGALIEHLPGGAFEPWTEWLPCDRVLVASGPAINPAPTYSQISAFSAGWVGLYPLQDRTAVLAVYSSRHISDGEVVDSLPLRAKMPISGDALVSESRCGTRKRPWIGNCVAVGEAATSLDLLDSVGLHITHSCLSHLMALFPAQAEEFPEARLYNQNVTNIGCNVRDFQCAHYRLNRRFDESFWDGRRDGAVPASLERKIDLFALCGQLPLYDDETFEEQDWASLLVGSGVAPRGYEPRVDAVPDEVQIGKVQQRLRDIAAALAEMPPMSEFLDQALGHVEAVA